jgi:hypothetical protein
MNIGNPFLFSYWAGPANPTRPTWIHNRARPWDPLGSHYLSSSPIVGASPVFAARAPRETLLAALRQAPSPRFPAPRAFPATHPDWRPSLRRFATPQLPPSVTEPPPPVGHNSSWHWESGASSPPPPTLQQANESSPRLLLLLLGWSHRAESRAMGVGHGLLLTVSATPRY